MAHARGNYTLIEMLSLINMRQPFPAGFPSLTSETGLTSIEQLENKIRRSLLAHKVLCANYKKKGDVSCFRRFNPTPGHVACKQTA